MKKNNKERAMVGPATSIVQLLTPTTAQEEKKYCKKNYIKNKNKKKSQLLLLQ